MGQAKQRGTFEQRREKAIVIAEAERLERQRIAEAERLERNRKAQEWWDALTPEQQEEHRQERRRYRSRNSLALSMSILPLIVMAGMGGMRGGSLIPRIRRG